MKTKNFTRKMIVIIIFHMNCETNLIMFQKHKKIPICEVSEKACFKHVVGSLLKINELLRF